MSVHTHENETRSRSIRMPHVRTSSVVTGALLVFLGGALASVAWYGNVRIEALQTEVVGLRTQLASTTSAFQSTLAAATTSIANQLAMQNRTVSSVKQDLGGISSQVGSINNTVGTLQKLSKIDPQLLEKYSKVYFLSENYVPASLVNIPAEYKYFDNRTLQVIPQVLPYLLNMLLQAKSQHVPIYVFSAYRSFSDQANLKSEYKVEYGSGANQFSADQGYSEHQLGTTVDLMTTGIGGKLTQAFDQTAAYTWLVNNAYKYGFVLSYPKGNSYYIYEPWHWRFVGVKLATDLHDSGEYFYDLSQRTIDTYLISLFN